MDTCLTCRYCERVNGVRRCSCESHRLSKAAAWADQWQDWQHWPLCAAVAPTLWCPHWKVKEDGDGH